MSDDDIFTKFGKAVVDSIKIVGSDFKRIILSPWQFRLYSDVSGVPPLPQATLDRLKALPDVAISPQDLSEALQIIEGLRDSVRDLQAADESSGEDAASKAFEGVLRMALPIALTSLRHSEHRGAYLVVAALAVLDEKIAEQLSGFTYERYVRELAPGANRLGLDDQSALLVPAMVLPTALWGILKLTSLPEGTIAAGWESELPFHQYGVFDAWQSTPIWMAHRTSSLHWPSTKTYTLSDYQTPESWDVPAQVTNFGFTIVPVPAKRTYDSDPALPAPEIADAGGPAMYLQIDGDLTEEKQLGHGFTLRARGNVAAGLLFSLGGPHPESSSGEDEAAGFSAGFEVELAWARPPAKTASNASPQGNAQGGFDVSVGGVAVIAFGGGGITESAHATDWGFGARISKLALNLTPTGVFGALVRNSLTTSLDLGLMWIKPGSSDQKLVIEGGSGLDLYLAVRKSVGWGSWLGATWSYMRIELAVQRGDNATKLTGTVTFGLELSVLRATLIADGFGVGATLQSNQPEGNLLGLGDFKPAWVPPDTLGLKLEWGPVKGGGLFGYDAHLDRYSGAVEVALGGTWTLRGVGFVEPRVHDPVTGASSGTTTVASLTFEVDHPSPGFMISGIGLFVGLHRTADVQAMRDALPTGAIDALMFPADPLGNTPQLVAALATMFPPAPEDQDSHVAGVLLRGSFASGFASASVGFLVKWGTGPQNETKILVPFSVKAGAQSGPLSRVFSLEVLGLGDYDAATHELCVHAVLRNSRVVGGDLVGGLVVFRGDPDPDDADRSRGTFVSIGGYHPSYFNGKGPPRARVDQRLGITISRGDEVKLEVQFYLAFTPSGFHVGLSGHLTVKASGFGVDGKLWLDGICDYSFDNFKIDVGGSVSLILFSETVASLDLDAELSRHPTYISGSVSLQLLWWSASYHFGKELTSETEQTVTVDDVHAELATALADPTSYPNAIPAAIALTTVDRAGVWNAPEQALTWIQKVVPLDTQVDRLGRAPLPSPLTIPFGGVTAGTSSGWTTRAASSEFAPAMYLSLDTDAAVHAPVAEIWPAGFAAGDDAVACGDDQGMTAQLDDIVIDRRQLVPPPPRRFDVPAIVLANWNKVSAVPPAQPPIRVAPPRYHSHVDDQPSTFAFAWSARGAGMRRTEGVR